MYSRSRVFLHPLHTFILQLFPVNADGKTTTLSKSSIPMAVAAVMSNESSSSAPSIADMSSVVSERSFLESLTTQTTPAHHRLSSFESNKESEDNESLDLGGSSGHDQGDDIIKERLSDEITAEVPVRGQSSSSGADTPSGDNQNQNGTANDNPFGTETAIEEPSSVEAGMRSAMDSVRRPRLLEENDEFWGSSPEEQEKRKELMNYINFLVNRNSLLDYNQNYFNPYADQYTTLPIEKPETEWKLEISHERTVQDSSGLDGIPKEDVGEVQEHSLRARPIGGPVLKRTREFDSKYQHTGTKIEVRSPLLVEALREAITAEQHSEFVTLHYDPVVFREPYMLLFHYWNDIVSLRDASDGDKEKQLEFLLSSLEHECPTIARVAKDLACNPIKTIVFEALWLLYRPGTTVFSRREGPLRAYIVESVSGGTKLAKGSFAPLKLSLRSSTAASAGKGCVQTYSTGVVDAFAAEAKIEGLTYVPAGFLPDEDEERRKLIDRGTTYVKLMEKPQVMEYKGNEWKKTWEEDTARVVIDVSMETAPPRARDEANHNPAEPYGAFRQPYALPGCNCSLCTGRDNQHRLGAHIPGCTCAVCIGSSVPQTSTWDATGVYLYLPHDIYAFSLVRKSWRSVAIDDLVPPFFEETMMSKKLVIDKDHREIVTSLVSSYTSGNFRFSDFVKGKGRGLVILLHGSPGTGKTLTAGKPKL
jgi:hypothetical protein